MEKQSCFLSGETDCELVDITIDGNTYWVDENIADEHSLKKLKELIKEKIVELNNQLEEEKKKKDEALDRLVDAATSLGLSKEDLGRLLLGQKEEIIQPEKPTEIKTQIKNDKIEEGFQEVDGELKTSVKAKVSADSQLPAGMNAYSFVKDNEGKTILEQGKKVKRLDDGALVEKSNMGVTVMRIQHRSGREVDSMLRQIDDDGNLVRASIAGSGTNSGSRTAECNLCAGSGITRIGHKECPKCGGTGTVII